MRCYTCALVALTLAAALGCDEPQPPTPDAEVSMPIVAVLALGDSLTLGYGSAEEGSGTEGGYRVHLAELLEDAGLEVDFVGSQNNGPERLRDRDHEGYNGYAIAQVAEVAEVAVTTFEPDVVLLMAGTNDQITFVPPSQSPEGAAADLDRLVTQIDAARPGVQIIVAQLIPLTHNDEGVRAYNALLPAVVTANSERGMNVRLVDMYSIGTENLSSDGIHPTAEGYDRIAEVWLPALVTAIGEL